MASAARDVVVGGDARHGSEEFALAAAEVFAAQGFMVTLLFAAVPTPVVAFGARHLGASAGIQITASHNPPSDNGYKVYFDGGLQIVPPTDREIEAMIGKAPHADQIPRVAVETSGVDLIQRYVDRASHVRRTHGSVRLALHRHARCRRRVRTRRIRPRRIVRRSRGRESVRARPGLPHRSVPRIRRNRERPTNC